jgi:predicted RNA binding protein YcfA (HicA-like mRNA interferase family)
MSSKFPSVRGADVVKAFEAAGFRVVATEGSHKMMKKEGVVFRLSVPCHNTDIGTGLLGKLIKQSGLTKEQFFEHLRNC